MSVCDVSHVGFTVADIDRSIRFYTEAIGLELRHRQIQKNEYTSSLIDYPDARLNVAQLTLPGGVASRAGHCSRLGVRAAMRRNAPEGTSAVGSGHLALEVTDTTGCASRSNAVAVGSSGTSRRSQPESTRVGAPFTSVIRTELRSSS